METTMGRMIELAPDQDELAWLRTKHMEYYLALAERAGGVVASAERRRVHEVLDAERENVRLAIEWAQSSGECEAVLRITSALFSYFHSRGLDAQTRTWTQAGLAELEEPASAVREKACRTLGWIHYWAGDYPDARKSFEQAHEIARALGIATGIAWALDGIAFAALGEGSVDEAKARCEEAVATARAAGDADDLAHLLQELAWLHLWGAGDMDVAAAAAEESLALFRRGGIHNDHIGELLQQLGEIALRSGDRPRARATFEEAVEFERAHGEAIAGRALGFLAGIAHDEGDLERWDALGREALVDYAEHGHFWGLAYALEGRSRVAAWRGDAARAVRLWGAADALRERIQKALIPQERERHEAHLSALRESLDASAFQSEWAVGRSMSTDQAVAYALET